MSVFEYRRGNLDFLIRVHGGQTGLACEIDDPVLSQRRLSDLQRGKKMLTDYQCKIIEEKLNIPPGWMGKDGWVRDGWEIVKKISIIDEKCDFINGRKFVEEVEFFLGNRLVSRIVPAAGYE